MAMVPAYDSRTGRKMPHHVPEHWFDHPVLGKHVRRTPRNAAANKKKADTSAATTPATGDNTDKEQ